MTEKQKHLWLQAATYIRAAFVEETHPIAVNTSEKAARYLIRAVENGEAPEEADMSSADKSPERKALEDAPQLATRLLCTSASDTDITMSLNAQNRPAETIISIVGVLIEMNNNSIEKRAHRQALAKAARKALSNLVEVPA